MNVVRSRKWGREIDVERRTEERERRREIFAVLGPRTLPEPVRVRQLRRRLDVYAPPNVSRPTGDEKILSWGNFFFFTLRPTKIKYTIFVDWKRFNFLNFTSFQGLRNKKETCYYLFNADETIEQTTHYSKAVEAFEEGRKVRRNR